MLWFSKKKEPVLTTYKEDNNVFGEIPAMKPQTVRVEYSDIKWKVAVAKFFYIYDTKEEADIIVENIRTIANTKDEDAWITVKDIYGSETFQISKIKHVGLCQVRIKTTYVNDVETECTDDLVHAFPQYRDFKKI